MFARRFPQTDEIIAFNFQIVGEQKKVISASRSNKIFLSGEIPSCERRKLM